MKNYDKEINIIKVLLSFVLFLYIDNIIKLCFKIFKLELNSMSPSFYILVQLIISIILFVVLLVFFYDKIKIDYKKFKKKFKQNIIYIIKLFVLFMLLKFTVSFITNLLLIIYKFDINSATSMNQEIIETFLKTSPILLLISSTLLGPFYEECLFRLSLKSVINNKVLFILISGLLFGLLHVFPLKNGITLTLGLIQSLLYVSMGWYFAYIYAKTDNIFMTIAIHFLNNLISLLVIINMF